MTWDAIHGQRRSKTHWFMWVMRLTLFFCFLLTGWAFDEYTYTYFVDECRGLITPSSSEFGYFFTVILLLPALLIMVSASGKTCLFISFTAWITYVYICYPAIFPNECTSSAGDWFVVTFLLTIIFTIFILLITIIFYFFNRSGQALHSGTEAKDA
jgi:hypothetical protein